MGYGSDPSKPRRRRKSSTGKSGGGGRVEWKGYVPCELTADQQRELAVMDLEVEFPLSMALEAIESGYKFAIQRDDKNSTYHASLYDVTVGSPTSGYLLSGRGSSAERAIASLFYKHLNVLADGWSTASTSKPDFA